MIVHEIYQLRIIIFYQFFVLCFVFYFALSRQIIFGLVIKCIYCNDLYKFHIACGVQPGGVHPDWSSGEFPRARTQNGLVKNQDKP